MKSTGGGKKARADLEDANPQRMCMTRVTPSLLHREKLRKVGTVRKREDASTDGLFTFFVSVPACTRMLEPG